MVLKRGINRSKRDIAGGAEMAELDYLFLGSVGVLVSALIFILGRVIKLYFDEKQAKRRREALRAMATSERESRNEREAVGKLLFFL